MSNLQLNRSQKGNSSFSVLRGPRCKMAFLLPTVALLFAALPFHPWARAEGDPNGKPISNIGASCQVRPVRARFRVTLNGLQVHHQTNQGLQVAWDSVVFRPNVAVVDSAGQVNSFIWGGVSSPIGSAQGGLRSHDGFPTQDSPWRRTVPNSPGAPGTIPPTVYFEGELVQNNAVVIIPSIWVVGGPKNLALVTNYQDSINRDRVELGRAVARIITGPQRLALPFSLSPGASMGLHNSIRLAIGVPQERPIGMQPEGNQFGFIPKVLVLTFDSADLMSRTDFGLGNGVIQVDYVDAPSFAGNYALYFQVERLAG